MAVLTALLDFGIEADASPGPEAVLLSVSNVPSNGHVILFEGPVLGHPKTNDPADASSLVRRGFQHFEHVPSILWQMRTSQFDNKLVVVAVFPTRELRPDGCYDFASLG